MPESGPADEQTEARIAELRRRWDERPSPRAGLQLAEELRRSGRLEDSQQVLERSLDENPGHLSSLVALGKTRLDLDDPAGAARNFEQVVDRDPTHLVANKLLIEAYLRQDDADRAGSRLEHYRLLNGGDPEIESVESRLAELSARLSEPGREPGQQAATAVAPPSGAPVVRAADGGANGDPFPALGRGDWRRYLEGLTASGIFPLPDLPAEEEALADEDGVEPAGADEGVVDEKAVDMEGVDVEGGTAEPPVIEPEVMGEPEAAAEDAAEEPPATQEDPADEPEAAVDEPELPHPEGARATSTLGELYLAQGHLGEAERVFREVLDRRPDDGAAAAGLAEVLRRRQDGLTAEDLLRWAAATGAVNESDSGGDRRAALLEAYGARLRSRAESEREEPTDVP